MSNNLAQWICKRGGYIHPSLDLLSPLSYGDRGVSATADIEEGCTLIVLPTCCTIHLPTAQQMNEEDVAKSYPESAMYIMKEHPATSPFLANVLVTMSELSRGDASAFSPYLTQLPEEDCNCLLSWTGAERAHLKGTTIDCSEEEPPLRIFKREVVPRISARPDLWPQSHATLKMFLRVVGLVQSRAFHLEAENWITGTKKEGADLFMLPGIDMINHSTDPSLRCTTLQKIDTPTSIVVDDGTEITFDSFFAMKAERPIKKGQQILHTYGDLSDAQLLQTYGFVDLGMSLGKASETSASPLAASPSSKKSKKALSGGKGQSMKAQPSASAVAVPVFINPHNYVAVTWGSVVAACRCALQKACPGEEEALTDFDSTLTQKRDMLVSSGVLKMHESSSLTHPSKLQAELGDENLSRFILKKREPLPEELLTTVQVLILELDDVVELYNDHMLEQKKPTGSLTDGKHDEASGKDEALVVKVARNEASSTSCSVSSPPVVSQLQPNKTVQANSNLDPATGKISDLETSGAGRSEEGLEGEGVHLKVPLSLGTVLLEDDDGLAQVVAVALMQIVDSHLKGYSASPSESDLLNLSEEMKKQEMRNDDKEEDATSSADPSTPTCTVTERTDTLRCRADRLRLAALIRLGEKEVLSLLKKKALMLLMGAAAEILEHSKSPTSSKNRKGPLDFKTKSERKDESKKRVGQQRHNKGSGKRSGDQAQKKIRH
ncbi:hypothetical protein CEUSTIGMA_g877.t1 [Chlamydomonas eustigma]|uniref:SET domain-containing protein n=1 Tax=Chlamydomonas eustigma TaxID=1157962 RepID=A0A250WRF9_9CHLO|nr:hypothetical protein CEUSTIGMA_g877.t1 [Chlamydomonas eustigma]|eukprot:GAX73425.1 hypothetical protein CEUSTIGMA_g877.t1 [Chlamydomonas eustigma]